MLSSVDRTGWASTPSQDRSTGRRVEDQGLPRRVGEIEHVVDGPRNRVERGALLNALAVQPVILDEPHHRALIDQGVVDVVLLRKRRDDQKRHAGAIAAANPYRCWVQK